jgi:multidrug efflux system membrane fusion protein
MTSRSLLLLLSASLFAAAGCERKQAPAGTSDVQAIPVSHPVERKVTDYVDFTGRTDAVEAVDIRARVTGFLRRMPFREGQEVRGDDRLHGGVRLVGLLPAPTGQGPLLAAASLVPGHLQPGDLLFEIDPRPYQLQLNQAISQVAVNEKSYELAKKIYDTDVQINAKVPGGVSQQQIDKEEAAMKEAEARVSFAKLSTDLYRLNLEYTKVTSPIDGQVGRYYLTRGNIVNQDQTLLTTVVSLDPIYAYFDMDEPTLQRIRSEINSGKVRRPEDGVYPVYMALQSEVGYPHRGTINFVNNQVNPATGSIPVRGVFANPKPPGGIRLLSPGMFVRIRLPIGRAHSEKLVTDRFIMSDQGKKFVYVVDADGMVQQRFVTTGTLQPDGLRVISEGLELEDRVVTGSLQQVRPKMKVATELRAMPSQPTQEPVIDEVSAEGDPNPKR